MKKNCTLFLTIMLLATLSAGCGDKSTSEKQRQTISDENTETTMDITDTADSTDTIDLTDITDSTDVADSDNTANMQTPTISKVELNNTYTTRFGEVNQITYPAFSFDYPDTWTVISEEVTTSSEIVKLMNDTGVTITYWNFGEMRDLTGPTRDIYSVDVTKVADASFIPNSVQETDYSDLGKFMVAKLKDTGEHDTFDSNESQEVQNKRVRYALLPESEAGEQEECLKVGLPTFSFWYGSHISLIATTPNKDFTEQEEKEVIAILASFRDNSCSTQYTNDYPESADSNTAATIDELWEKLAGEWTFEEYIYLDKPTSFKEHTLELRYVDKKPCMSRIYDTGANDEFFYDFEATDEFHYNAYIYKKDNYGDDSANWEDDTQLVWYSFDLSNISNKELLVSYHILFDNGFIDNHTFKYSLKN